MKLKDAMSGLEQKWERMKHNGYYLRVEKDKTLF